MKLTFLLAAVTLNLFGSIQPAHAYDNDGFLQIFNALNVPATALSSDQSFKSVAGLECTKTQSSQTVTCSLEFHYQAETIFNFLSVEAEQLIGQSKHRALLSKSVGNLTCYLNVPLISTEKSTFGWCQLE